MSRRLCLQFFNYARDAKGLRKGLIELRPVVDVDGARDEVWHFVRGRAYELGALYFGCASNAPIRGGASGQRSRTGSIG